MSIGSYEVGSVFIEMFDPDKPVPSEEQLPAIVETCLAQLETVALTALFGLCRGRQAGHPVFRGRRQGDQQRTI